VLQEIERSLATGLTCICREAGLSIGDLERDAPVGGQVPRQKTMVY
jgi:hypothetical protein